MATATKETLENSFTLEKLKAAILDAELTVPRASAFMKDFARYRPRMATTFRPVGVGMSPSGPIDEMRAEWGGVQIIKASEAMAVTEERLFPESKNRSARIHKKLVKRHGGEFRKVPAIFMMNGNLLVHPAKLQELEQAMAKSMETTLNEMCMGVDWGRE